MRHIGIPVVLALVAAGLAGSSNPVAARTPLSVAVDCSPGSGSFSCDAVVSGGVTPYLSYYWTITESPAYGQVYGQYQVVTSDPSVSSSCTINNGVTVDVMVVDNRGGTATGSSALQCPE